MPISACIDQPAVGETASRPIACPAFRLLLLRCRVRQLKVRSAADPGSKQPLTQQTNSVLASAHQTKRRGKRVRTLQKQYRRCRRLTGDKNGGVRPIQETENRETSLSGNNKIIRRKVWIFAR